jgi:hypothetical protein
VRSSTRRLERRSVIAAVERDRDARRATRRRTTAAAATRHRTSTTMRVRPAVVMRLWMRVTTLASLWLPLLSLFVPVRSVDSRVSSHPSPSGRARGHLLEEGRSDESHQWSTEVDT